MVVKEIKDVKVFKAGRADRSFRRAEADDPGDNDTYVFKQTKEQ